MSAVPRLVCTLRGPGTEFSPARPDGRELPGVVHRSPPADAAATRLLVVVDPIDEAHPC